MGWTIKYTRSAEKAVKKLDPQVRLRIRDYMEQRVRELNNPRDLGAALQGEMAEFWRYRIGEHRVECELRDEALIVLVVRVGHRKQICR